jgi:hypothetical protein
MRNCLTSGSPRNQTVYSGAECLQRRYCRISRYVQKCASVQVHLAASAICRGSHVTPELGVPSLELLHVALLTPTFEHPSNKGSLGPFPKFRKATISFVMYVHKKQLGSQWTDFHEIWYLDIFRKSVEKEFNFHENRTGITGTLQEW